jgi:hypothetical protein
MTRNFLLTNFKLVLIHSKGLQLSPGDSPIHYNLPVAYPDLSLILSTTAVTNSSSVSLTHTHTYTQKGIIQESGSFYKNNIDSTSTQNKEPQILVKYCNVTNCPGHK